MDRSHDAEFSEFVAARSASLFRTAFLLVGDHGQAEDLVQTALTKAYLAWRRIRTPEAAEAYTRRILVTTAVTWRRRASWWERPHRDAGGPPERGVGGFGSSQPDAAITVTERDWMHRALHALPPGQRAAVVLRFYTDLSERQTAQAMGCSVGTVKSQTHHGLAALRVLLGTDLAEHIDPIDAMVDHPLDQPVVTDDSRPAGGL